MTTNLVDLTPIFSALILVLAGIVTVKVVPVLNEKLSSSQRETIIAWIKIAVKAAEQLCKDGRLNPAERYQWVVDYITKWLEESGFTLDFDKLEKMIEAVVSELPKTFESDVEKRISKNSDN